jgi:hypothetical protein
VRITLVHGTWGRLALPRPWRSGKRTPFWFDQDSRFSEQLRSELQRNGFSPYITGFPWSGTNSIMHRDRGAEDLAKYLREEHLRFPMSLQVVIAHSHGGNLALRALVRLVDLAPTLPFLVTLATPFVSVVPADLDPKRTKSTNAALFAGLLIIFLLALPRIFGSLVDASFLAFFVVVLILAIVWLPLVKSLYAKRQKIAKLVEATATRTISLHESFKLLVLRSIDDEASLTLAAGAIGNRLARVMFFTLTRVLVLYANVFCFTFIAFFVFAYVSNFFGASTGAEAIFKGVFGLPGVQAIIGPSSIDLFFAIPILGLALLGVAGLCKCVYGRELALGSTSCVINSQSVPDKMAGELTVTTLSENIEPRRLRHMIYDDRQSAAVIAEWPGKQAMKLRTEFRTEIVGLVRSRASVSCRN